MHWRLITRKLKTISLEAKQLLRDTFILEPTEYLYCRVLLRR